MNTRYLLDFRAHDVTPRAYDVLVVGSGIAGLSTALHLPATTRVALVAKAKLGESNTRYAQGGIAAPIHTGDSPDLHLHDTLEAGAGLCDEGAVRIMVNEAAQGIEELMAMGTAFDRQDGELLLGKEGAHSRHRILHAGGDATGAEIERSLVAQVHLRPNIDVYEDAFALDLLTAGPGAPCAGALIHHGERLWALLAPATILATGGAGQLWYYTTNPRTATGDGLAIAYRAGATLRDLEFMQFHPTALMIPDAAPFLVSEAVRGEGAYLRDAAGNRFMPAIHTMAELAPRDVVARAIAQTQRRTGKPVYLDLRHLDPANVLRRFPTITAVCARNGLDLARDLIPVSPAAHYYMGGIETDYEGRTSLPGLYAVGECACNGVHGANRLASNSLLDGLVFGRRAALASVADQHAPLPSYTSLASADAPTQTGGSLVTVRESIRHTLWERAGLFRTGSELTLALDQLAHLNNTLAEQHTTTFAWETQNMLTLATLITQAALTRTESRGGHDRDDYPQRDDTHWLRHITFTRQQEARAVVTV